MATLPVRLYCTVSEAGHVGGLNGYMVLLFMEKPMLQSYIRSVYSNRQHCEIDDCL